MPSMISNSGFRDNNPNPVTIKFADNSAIVAELIEVNTSETATGDLPDLGEVTLNLTCKINHRNIDIVYRVCVRATAKRN